MSDFKFDIEVQCLTVLVELKKLNNLVNRALRQDGLSDDLNHITHLILDLDDQLSITIGNLIDSVSNTTDEQTENNS